MYRNDYNIFHIDDIFIKIGYGCLVFFVLTGGTIISKLAKAEAFVNPHSMYIGAAMFGVPALIFLVIGYTVRRRENTAASVWRKLDAAPEVPGRDLMSGTGLSSARIGKALLAINRRGRGLYVWDRDTDMIVDTRLNQGMILVEVCDRCGARVGKKFPVTLERVPQCPYCGNPLSIERWNDLKRRVIDEVTGADIKARQADARQPANSSAGFSRPVFFILLLIFWPAALVYALVRYHGG